MYYFIDNNYSLVSRPHKFNAEYLDGRLKLIDENDPCYIVKHTPNSEWTYDLERLAIIAAGYGWEKIEFLNSKIEPQTPPTYHSLIPVTLFWDYVNKNVYKDKTTNVEILESDTGIAAANPQVSLTVEPPAQSVIGSNAEDAATMNPIPLKVEPIPTVITLPNPPNTVEPLNADYVPNQNISQNDSGMYDALNGGHYPNPRYLESDPVYKFKSPAVKNT